MPLPAPSSSEDQSKFISRCAGDPVMNKEWPKNPERLAVCYSIWKRHVKNKRAKASEENPTWDEAAAEISEANMIRTETEIRVLPPKDRAK